MLQIYKTFYQNAVEGMIVANGIGIIELVNPSLLEMFNYKEHELLGQPIEILVPYFFKGKNQKHKERYTLKNEERKKEGEVRSLIGHRKDQSQFPIEIRFNYCYMEEDLKSITTVTDITKIVKPQHDFQELNTKLDRIVKIRTKEIEAQKEQALKQNQKIKSQNQKIEVQKNQAIAQKEQAIAQKEKIEVQKEQALKQNQEIKSQKEKIEAQKEQALIKNQEIKDSIYYAQRLQNATLPSFKEVNKYIPNHFIYFKAKDVVSGDFYWFEQLNDTSYFAAADCTGHGVPGAILSVICSNALNRSIKEFGITEPSKILDKTRELVIETFAKSGEDVKDGMDIAMCAFKEKKVIYSGANNPLWIVRKTDLITEDQKVERSTIINNGLSLIEHKSNKQPIGLYAGMKDFTQEEIDLHPGDTLYFFTDGFADQFGGEKGKKFKYKPFKRFLIDLQTKPINERAQLISDSFENWRGELDQIDDVCVIGVEIE
ncbi:MAG: hypothetical protein COB15_13610 [Flavobacteriales bacterium]|nr:MAG: hypothetical protein COB15_13610 [Flavobacteriales bacterium]